MAISKMKSQCSEHKRRQDKKPKKAKKAKKGRDKTKRQ
jgi:hypothetical protein